MHLPLVGWTLFLWNYGRCSPLHLNRSFHRTTPAPAQCPSSFFVGVRRNFDGHNYVYSNSASITCTWTQALEEAKRCRGELARITRKSAAEATAAASSLSRASEDLSEEKDRSTRAQVIVGGAMPRRALRL